ncbi:UNVERIFIED_CONTAM: protein PHLOEM PROTEIN 2-LIKE A1 [Sesamum latifolium]|uniref:Protein PHLOEM PROTEIN 2-LIKE A1 n=1 Tax=Sesamum latifolium TaxID=2727402 RepID=A0AAW2WLS8_9LAMI
MGAGLSQDKATQPNDEGSSNNTSQSSNSDAKPSQSATQVLLPHNCEDILKHADSPIDRSSTKKLLEQLYAGLTSIVQKYWVEKGSNRNCFILFARDLSITWADDDRFWHWTLLKELSDECLAVAELLNVCWLEVHGRFEIANLSPGTMYEIVFVLKLKDTAYGLEVPVNLRLTLPDGSRQEHKENLKEKPRGQWIEIPAGEFNTSDKKIGEIEFSLYEYEGGKWKRGLLIKGASIRPKASVL